MNAYEIIQKDLHCNGYINVKQSINGVINIDVEKHIFKQPIKKYNVSIAIETLGNNRTAKTKIQVEFLNGEPTTSTIANVLRELNLIIKDKFISVADIANQYNLNN